MRKILWIVLFLSIVGVMAFAACGDDDDDDDTADDDTGDDDTGDDDTGDDDHWDDDTGDDDDAEPIEEFVLLLQNAQVTLQGIECTAIWSPMR